MTEEKVVCERVSSPPPTGQDSRVSNPTSPCHRMPGSPPQLIPRSSLPIIKRPQQPPTTPKTSNFSISSILSRPSPEKRTGGGGGCQPVGPGVRSPSPVEAKPDQECPAAPGVPLPAHEHHVPATDPLKVEAHMPHPLLHAGFAPAFLDRALPGGIAGKPWYPAWFPGAPYLGVRFPGGERESSHLMFI